MVNKMCKIIKKGIICVVLLSLFLSTSIPAFAEQSKNSIDNDSFDCKIENLMKQGHMPSLVACIVKNNTMVWSNAYGYYKYYMKKNASVDIIYPIASITKSFTATAIMQLNESGLIGLDDNVSNYLNFDLKNPKYPNVNITVKMLLAHQSSIGDRLLFTFYFFYLNYSEDNFSEFFLPGGKFYNKKNWKDYAPGENVCYTGIGFLVLGYVIEKITNQSLEDYFQNKIFRPLNMMNTSLYFSNFCKNRICGLYSWTAGRYIPFPIREYGLPADGGIKTTIIDMSHYLIMHANGGVYNGVRILKEESVEEMHKIQYPDSYDGNVQHGFGWYSFTDNSTGEKYGGHSGNFIGAQSFMRLRYSDNVGIIFLWNQDSFFLHFLHIVNQDEKDARQQIIDALFKKAEEY